MDKDTAARIDDLRNALRERIDSLETEIQTIRNETDRKLSELQASVSSLKGQITRLRTTINDAGEELTNGEDQQ